MISGSERSPGEGNGNLLQCSCLGNPMNRGAWWAAGQRVTEVDRTERLSSGPVPPSTQQLHLGTQQTPWSTPVQTNLLIVRNCSSPTVPSQITLPFITFSHRKPMSKSSISLCSHPQATPQQTQKPQIPSRFTSFTFPPLTPASLVHVIRHPDDCPPWPRHFHTGPDMEQPKGYFERDPCKGQHGSNKMRAEAPGGVRE